MNDTELRKYLEKLARTRGIPFQFDRFQSDAVVSDGLKLNLDIIEVDRGRPVVVFVPGTSVYSLLYSEFLLALADRGYNIVGSDPRGHGRSEGAPGSYTVAELVTDTRAAVGYARKRFNDQIAVVGSSQGGIVAFYVAATEEKLAGVVCHNVADLCDPASVKLTRNPALSRLMKPLLPIFASLAPELKIPISLYLDLEAEPMRGFGNAKVFLDQDPLAYKSIRLKGMASLASEKLPRPVEQITTPVQILHAGRDNIFPQDYVEYIYNRLTCKKSLKIYPDLPHLILTEHVDIVVPDVAKWLEEIFK
ncbi:MAG: hypothetical protein A2V67_19250 [Deltaproteobacteria bacterium RBG_13_61_14]|nr:MAG: hypothetical protein A2V67_19250 [Deltaproteobacteria bacterium RBG_13_61_14]